MNLEPRILMAGLAIGESPRWHDGLLWFCNWGTGEIVAVDLEGKSEVAARVPARIPYCIDWMPNGRLLVVSGREGLLLRQEPDGTFVTHADLNGLSRLGWNEIVVDGRGNTYVNGGNFDFSAGASSASGIIALVDGDGSVRQVADGIAFPNGMAVTPDNSTLIVAESYASRLTAFDITGDGSLSNRRVWASVERSAPDGICLDADGAVWFADVPNTHCVRVREGGEVLQIIQVDRGCFACMLGGVDKPVLFITAAEWHGFEGMAGEARMGQLLSVEAPAIGAGWP